MRHTYLCDVIKPFNMLSVFAGILYFLWSIV